MQPDPDTLSLLDLIDSDPRRDNDRAAIDRAVERVAMAHGGVVSTNNVRVELRSKYGTGYIVSPQAIGPRLAALTRRGVLRVVGEDINLDREGRNYGKKQPLRRYVGEAA